MQIRSKHLNFQKNNNNKLLFEGFKKVKSYCLFNFLDGIGLQIESAGKGISLCLH